MQSIKYQSRATDIGFPSFEHSKYYSEKSTCDVWFSHAFGNLIESEKYTKMNVQICDIFVSKIKY